MQTTTGEDFGIFLVLFAIWLAISIFVIRMGVLSITRELHGLNKQISYLNGLLYARLKSPPEP